MRRSLLYLALLNMFVFGQGPYSEEAYQVVKNRNLTEILEYTSVYECKLSFYSLFMAVRKKYLRDDIEIRKYLFIRISVAEEVVEEVCADFPGELRPRAEEHVYLLKLRVVFYLTTDPIERDAVCLSHISN